MNELYQLKKLQRSLDLWMEDRYFLRLFERDTEAEYGKEARAAKRAQQKTVVEDNNPLRRMIKKPTTQKGGVNGKRQVPVFY